MAAKKKRIAVIGGGFAGFCSIVMLKEEELEPVCFEQMDNPGGSWFYREESIEGLGSLMATTVLNTSKEMSAISNFPPRKELHNYMRPHEMYQYFTEYHSQYECLKHVKFNMMVTSVKRSEDYGETGKWKVTAKNTITEEELADVYDGVMVCVGHMNRPVIPKYPGQEIFKG
ncbi:Dimethylaniline monooxygenase [N-oxide-forming] 5, partial [Stegodyphus mimosarum]